MQYLFLAQSMLAGDTAVRTPGREEECNPYTLKNFMYINCRVSQATFVEGEWEMSSRGFELTNLHHPEI